MMFLIIVSKSYSEKFIQTIVASFWVNIEIFGQPLQGDFQWKLWHKSAMLLELITLENIWAGKVGVGGALGPAVS